MSTTKPQRTKGKPAQAETPHEHTPGPWHIPDWRQLGRIDVTTLSGVIVAAVYLQRDPITVKGWPTEEANARLIAAAPDLLAACESALPAVLWGATHQPGNMSQWHTTEVMLRAVIAKAKPR